MKCTKYVGKFGVTKDVRRPIDVIFVDSCIYEMFCRCVKASGWSYRIGRR